MFKSVISEQDRRAAIICSHVATEHCSILRAVRDKPTMPEDSGWQFLCDRGKDEISAKSRVWLVCEVLDYDRSLVPFIEYPPGTILTRQDQASEWKVFTKEE
jgi:hypothetical protein